MKKILASLLAAYTLTNGQQPPVDPAPVDPLPVVEQATPLILPPGEPPLPPGFEAATPVPEVPTVVDPLPVVVDPLPAVDPATPVDPAIPVQQVRVTPAPITARPTPQPTPDPTTAAPTTAAPTYNPYCPMPMELGSTHGVTSGNAMSSNQGCISPFERATAFNGILQCSQYACCQCAEIQCGDPFGLACDELVISSSGAVGNQNINVLGDMTSAYGGMSFGGIGGAMNNGAQIGCNGLEACKATKIYGKYVGQLKCSGDMGCAGANILLEDPGQDLQVLCAGMMSCMNTNLEIVITPNSQVTELQSIEFNGQQSAQGMTITIRNEAQYPVMLQTLECMNPTACPNLRINIIGNIFIENCDLQHMNIQTAGPSLLAACQAGGAMQGGGVMPGLGFPPQQYTPPVQAPPTNPGSFNPPVQAPPQYTPPVQAPPQYTPPVQAPPQYTPPVQQPATPVTPIQQPPAAVNPYVGIGFIDPQQLTCNQGQCRNRAITVTPHQHFKLICDVAMGCDGMTLNLNVGGASAIYGGFLTEIQVLKFTVPTRGATININGYAEINDIRCEVAGACNGLTINAPNVEMTQLNMDCQQPGSCMGCTFNGMDCSMLSMQQNNNGAFGYYGNNQYGYVGQPQQPAQPAYNPYGAQPQQAIDPYQQYMMQQQWQQWI